MNTLSALLLIAASVAAVSASGECSDEMRISAGKSAGECPEDPQITQAKELNKWAANVVADVVHAGMSVHSKQGADGWVKAYQISLAPASSGPELKASYSASAHGVSSTVCSGLCTAADVACKHACAALPGFLQGPSKAACGLAITACNGAC